MIRSALAVALVASAFTAGGCGEPVPPNPAPPAIAPSHTPSGTPSKSSMMVCAEDAQHEISLSLAQELVRPVTPTWSDHLYACHYVYPVGTITLSVKELADPDTAAAYFDSLRKRSGTPPAVPALGRRAFLEADGSLVVQKDFLVLRVDVKALAGRFGQPPMTRAEAARRVGADIMSCWMGQ